MRRGVGRPVIRLCRFLCPVCPPLAQPVIWDDPVTTADWERVLPFSEPGGAEAGARDTASGVRASAQPASCAALRGGLWLGRRHPGVVSNLVRPQRDLVCFGPAVLRALPHPLLQRERGR